MLILRGSPSPYPLPAAGERANNSLGEPSRVPSPQRVFALSLAAGRG